MIYIIRTLRTQTQVIVRKAVAPDMVKAVVSELQGRGMQVRAYQFANDSEARMFIDPACAYFRKAAEAIAA